MVVAVSCEMGPERLLGPPPLAPDGPSLELTYDDCPEDAPDCLPADGDELDELRDIVRNTIPGGLYMCDIARAKLLQAIDDGEVDTFADYNRIRNGQIIKVGGTFNQLNGRFSFNRTFFAARCNMGWCNKGQFSKTAAHEGGHAAIAASGGSNTESNAEWFESSCVEW